MMLSSFAVCVAAGFECGTCRQLATRWDGMPWKGSAPEVWTVKKQGLAYCC